MKSRLFGDADAPLSSSRRRLLMAAAAGTSLAMFPFQPGTARPVKISPYAPVIGLGYCKPPPPDAVDQATLADALTLASMRGTFELRVIGANTSVPLAIAAEYGLYAQHYFWQAWLVGDLLQRSSPIAIRWAANARNALPLTINVSEGGGTAQIAARPGVFALTVSSAAQRQPAWANLGLREAFTDGVEMRLVTRSNGEEVNIPYALFEVRAIDDGKA